MEAIRRVGFLFFVLLGIFWEHRITSCFYDRDAVIYSLVYVIRSVIRTRKQQQARYVYRKFLNK